MIQIAGDINLPGWSGMVAALQNSLTIAGSTSGNVVIGNVNNLLPGQDLSQDVGALDLRWRNSFVSSGNFSSLTINDVPSSGDTPRQNIIYVGKHGSNDNDGLHPERPLLTIAAAEARALVLGVGHSNPYTIEVLDGGVYGESFKVPPYVTLYGPRATVSGMIDVGDNSTVDIDELRVVASGVTTYGIARRNVPGTPATVSGVSSVRINRVVAFTENFVTIFPIYAGSSGALNVQVNTAICTSGTLLFANGGGQLHYRGNEAQVGSPAGLSDGFAVLLGPAAIIANVNRVRGDQNEKFVNIGGDQASGLFIVNEIDVGLLEFGIGFTNADIRIFANSINTRIPSFAAGTYSHHCVVDTCSLSSVVNNFSRPVDARPVSGSIKLDTNEVYDLGEIGTRWASLHAASGLFGFGQIDLAEIDIGSVTSSFTIDGSASFIMLGNGTFFGGSEIRGVVQPDVAHTQEIGSSFLPFGAFHASSGIFDHLRPPTGSDPDHILMSGHFVPAIDLTYDLGAAALRWATVRAGSGVFSDDVTITDDLTVGGGIAAGGNVGGNTISATVGAVGVMLNTSLVTNTRAEFSTSPTLNTGSGYALRNENIWYDHLRANTEGVDISTLTMSMDGLSTRPYAVPIADANSVVLADHFAIITTQGTTVDLDDWYAYVRRTQSDGSVEATSGIVASGQIGWSSTGDTVHKTWGRWNTSGNVPVEFEPGSCYDVVIHNDGSGTTVNAPVARLTMGFRINANAVDLGRGE